MKGTVGQELFSLLANYLQTDREMDSVEVLNWGHISRKPNTLVAASAFPKSIASVGASVGSLVKPWC